MPSDIETREARRQEILAFLHRARVASQQEVVDHLVGLGIAATQSSVSRDLRDLGVARVAGRYVPPSLPPSAALGSPAAEAGIGRVARFLREMRPAGPHLTVLLTSIGTAQTLAFALDQASWPEVVGTIAGDDTVFVATASAGEQRRFLERLESMRKEDLS